MSLFQFGSSKLTVKVAHKGGTDHGVFAIAFAMAIAFGMNPQLKQESLRAHLVACFHKRHLSLFPYNALECQNSLLLLP